MKVPLLDLVTQYQSIRDEINTAINEVFESQQFILGDKVRQCEELIAQYCRTKYAVGVSSGTDALLICLMAEKIGPGDEVITTPYTFFATAGSIARTGAKPVFVDIEPDTFNINPSLIHERITPRTKAIIPVHLYGQMCQITPIMELASQHNLIVIEDSAQAIGAEDKGKRAGSAGDYGCLSFFPSKNLGGAGDGGMVLLNDEIRTQRLRQLRVHGSEQKYFHSLIGGNFRLDALQAAVLIVKLKYLDKWIADRQLNARRYIELFHEMGLTSPDLVRLPVVKTDRHVFNQFVIRVPQRDELKKYLAEHGIGTEVYYPVPLHLQKCFSYLGYKEGEFPESEKAARETIALPIYPELTPDQQVYVVKTIKSFYKK
jgi:dTDP-4-amino-4,6-dideoxygalactose transaminase